jgi:high-affinity iron transporter
VLATLVIGLREGLEAALIVGIIAAFLKRNGHSLRSMWIGVIAAILMSVGVGVALELVSASLPQAQQEAMETIIGAVAIVFVTGMIVWMNTHARGMRRELEASASAALGDGTALALAGMAFLAVLKEGFETSVFLLATFQSSTSTPAAVAGAVIGIGIAIGIGIGIYRGGVKLNLGKFFKITGVFLVFVAAGLVVSMLRTAHEAGWLSIGQQNTIDLSWLAPTGSVQAALITGVLGIPADPRVVEVIGWLCYLIPVLAYCLWPIKRRPRGIQVPRLQIGIAAALAAAAIILAVAVPATATADPSAQARLVGGGTASLHTAGNSVTLVVERDGVRTPVTFNDAQRTTTQHAGMVADRWRASATITPAHHPKTVTIDDLVALEGGRLPVGVDAQSNPGPFTATWRERVTRTLWSVNGQLLDAKSTADTVITISDGGLPSPRTFSAPDSSTSSSGTSSSGTSSSGKSDAWSMTNGSATAASAAIAQASAAASEALLWKLYLPIAAAVAALVLLAFGLRGRRRLTKLQRIDSADAQPSTAQSPTPRSTPYAAK